MAAERIGVTSTVRDGKTVDLFIDVLKPEFGVEIEVDRTGTVLWLSVDGITLVRVSKLGVISIKDGRTDA
jgi:hypothetical protein